MLDMYKGVVNSPETTITNDISNIDTIIYILDETRVPDELPNLMTLGTGTAAETIKVLSVNGNALTVERGFQGVAKAWNAGTVIARNFTEYDYNALKENIEELEETKETPAGAQTKADTAETNAKNFASGLIGSLGSLLTTAKTNVVAAINELLGKHNDLADAHAAHLADFMPHGIDNAGFHNSIYRGKFLGNSATAEQYANIANGTFEDLYIGDYWTIGGVNYRIACFDYYYNIGDSACTTHHAVIVPDTTLYNHSMNDTNITDGGYVNSKMYIEGLTQAKTTIESAFSGHVLNHRQLLSNATTDGKASGWSWYDSKVELMTEPMLYGSVVWGESTIGGSGYNIGVDKSQLPLFALNPRMINTRQSYWLRDVVSAAYFAGAFNHGNANLHYASSANGVRPAFSIS